MFVFWMMIVVLGIAMGENQTNSVTDPMVLFKERTPGPIGMLTTSSGEPVTLLEASNTLNIPLLNNNFFMDVITHLNREKLPERIVHAKGAGAFGYFEVTHDISHICKANFLNKVGKKTPIAVRFSTTVGERGSSDLNVDGRGFAVKFYTEEGNFDILGFNTPMYVYKDPLEFRSFMHAFKRNPATGVHDYNAVWDMFTTFPYSLHQFILTYSGRGIPLSLKHMPGYGMHTYQLENEHGVLHFVRFFFLPDAGIKNLPSNIAKNISITDADFLTRDLFKQIAEGNFMYWTVKVQILTIDDVKKEGSRIFDVTRTIPLDDYPLHSVGKFVLNRNPKNYFAEVEQLAFCPGNLVSGICGAPGKLFEARRMAYRSAQSYRLGVNFNKIAINCPFRTKTFTYNRDGQPPVSDNERDTPNYYPNSFNGPVPHTAKHRASLIDIVEDKPDNFDQSAELYADELTSDEREQLIDSIVHSLSQAKEFLQEKAIKVLSSIHPNLGERVALGMNRTTSNY